MHGSQTKSLLSSIALAIQLLAAARRSRTAWIAFKFNLQPTNTWAPLDSASCPPNDVTNVFSIS